MSNFFPDQYKTQQMQKSVVLKDEKQLQFASNQYKA